MFARFAGLVAALMLAFPAVAQNTSVGFGGGNHNSRAPVEVAADSLQVDQESGHAVLEGNVLIIQDTLRLTAQKVEIDYTQDEGNRQVHRLLADGDVLIVAGTDAAEGQTAVYELGSGQIIMTGNVLLTQGQDALSGQRLVVNLNTGAGTVSGRVRTVFGSGAD